MLYIFKQIDKDFLNERFCFANEKVAIQYFWQANDGSLGFNTDQQGVLFMKEFLSDALTILQPKFILIKQARDIENNVNNFRGVSFWGIDAQIECLWQDHQLSLKKKKKNVLLKRYGRVTAEVIPSELDKWVKEGRFTENFLSFYSLHKSVIWAFSDFGIYFYEIGEGCVKADAIELCNRLNIAYKEVTETNNLPFH